MARPATAPPSASVNGRGAQAAWATHRCLSVFAVLRLITDDTSRDLHRPAAQTRLRRSERLARADRRLAATTDQWDADSWLLNTPGGVVDLCSGEVHPHQPIRYMTKITAVEPIGPCPQWRRFLDRIFAGDGRTDRAKCAKNKI